MKTTMLKTSPTLSSIILVVVATVAVACGTSARPVTRSNASMESSTTLPAVDSQIIGALKSALDVDYELGSQPAVAGDSQAAIALGLSPQLSAVFADPAYSQVRLGLTNSHLNGMQGPPTYILAVVKVVSITPAINPTQATVYACRFDSGAIFTATHQTVTDPPGVQSGWAYGTWNLVNQGGTWKVSNYHFDFTPTTDGGHPICKNEPSPSSAAPS